MIPEHVLENRATEPQDHTPSNSQDRALETTKLPAQLTFFSLSYLAWSLVGVAHSLL